MNNQYPAQVCTTCKYLHLYYNFFKDKLVFYCDNRLWWPSKNLCKKKNEMTSTEISEQYKLFKQIIDFSKKDNSCQKQISP